jgi:hypothetical protein
VKGTTASKAGIAAPLTTFQQVSLKPPYSEGDISSQSFNGTVRGRAVVKTPFALVATASVSDHDKNL